MSLIFHYADTEEAETLLFKTNYPGPSPLSWLQFPNFHVKATKTGTETSACLPVPSLYSSDSTKPLIQKWIQLAVHPLGLQQDCDS